MAAFTVEIKGGEEFVEYWNRADEMAQLTMLETMRIIGLHGVERSRVNAPIADGDLRRSIRFEVVRTSSGFEVKIICGVSYALRMHEFLTPFGPLQLGPGSRREAAAVNAPEGGVGGKFIERVVNFHVGTYLTYVRDMLEENLGDQTATIRTQPDVGPIRPS